MRRLIYLAFVLVLSSCGIIAPKTIFVSSVTWVDYKPYSDQGFFITESNSVSFDYIPVSSLSSIYRSGYASVDMIDNTDRKERGYRDDVYSKTIQTRNTKVEVGDFIEATPQDALDELYRKAVELGANGIINLRIGAFTEIGTDNRGDYITLIGYTATGMAIKR